MNKYAELSAHHQKEVDAFPIGAAFSKKQFTEMMEKWGLDPDKDVDKIYRLPVSGCYIRKSDNKAFTEMMDRHALEKQEFFAADTTGERGGHFYQALLYELENHEYCVTYDPEPALNALGFSVEEIETNAALYNALNAATADIAKAHEEMYSR